MTVPANPWEEDGFPSGSATHFANTYWAFRRLPNLFFLHYGDLMTDLAGDMRRLSAFLDIPVSERLWPTLVEAAGFNAMKANAAAAAPGAHLGEWRSNADFFRMARMGQWREGLSAQSQALYEHLSAERLAPPLKAWLEGGHAAAGDPKNA
jgi:aryl sulfotransferase